MALNLEELRFVVDTTELDAAAKKIGALGDALNKVNKPVKESAINAEKLAQAQANTAEATAKAELAAAKAALAAEKLGKAQDGASSSSKAQVSILEKQIMVLEYMAQGHSRGQASMMATAKVAGAVSTEIDALSSTLKTQRTLMGTDPFDKSIGALESWTNKLKVATEVEQLYNQSLGLTKAQMQELAIEKQRLIALAAMEGKSMQQVEAEYQKIIGIASNLAQKQNTITSTIKQQEKALGDAAKATAYLADADARLAAALDVSNAKLDKAGSDALVKYEKALRQSGMSADEAAAKLAHAKTQFDAIADKKQADRLQYLARAISVQMGDVGISLASGMNPLLVMIQQGDQIRGAIQQAGASGKELEKAMAEAAGQIARSFLQTAQAIGGFFVNAIKSAGSAILGFPFSLMKDGFLSISANADVSAQALERLKIATIAFGKVGIIALLTALTAFTVATYDNIKEQLALTRALTLTGASLGISTQAAYEQADAMKALGITHGDSIKVMTEMAKQGGFTAAHIKMVTEAAVGLEKYGGVAIKETVKQFSELGKDPVKGLIDYAKATGLVTTEQIRFIKNLVDTDQKVKAVDEAIKLMGSGSKQAIQQLRDQSGLLVNLWLDLADAVKWVKDAILGMGRIKFAPEDITQTLMAIKKLEEARDRGFTNEQAARMNENALKTQNELLEKQKRLATSNSEAYVASTRANANNAKTLEDTFKKEEEAKKYLESLNKDINKLIAEGAYAQEHLNKAQLKMIELINDPKFVALPMSTKSKTLATLALASASLEAAKAFEEQEKAAKKAQESYPKINEDTQKIFENAGKENEQLELRLSLLGKTTEEQKLIRAEHEKNIKLAQIEVDLQRRLREIRRDLAGDPLLLVVAEKEAVDAAAEQRKIANKEVAVKAAEDLNAEYQRISGGLSDAIVTALFEGGKAGSKKLRDLIIAELKKPITVVVKAMVDIVSSSISGGLNSMLGGASGSPLTSTLGNMASSYLLGSNAAYGAAIGTTSVGAGSQAAMLAAQTGEFGAAGLKATASAAGTTSSIATAVPYVAAALVALNVLGAFRSTKQVGGGISGTLGEGDINSYATMRKSGTLIRGPSYWRENRGEFSGSDALQASFAQLKASTATMAEAVGVSSDSVKDFTKKIEISFDGLTETQIQEKIATTFKGVGDELAALVLGAGATAEQLSSLYNNIMQQRYDLETKLLELQGDTVALRERERAKIYETNKALFDQIAALEDKKAADEEAAKAAAEYSQQITAATKSVTDEINRLRGINTSQTGLESQFAILTAQARAGDLEALAKLPAITQGLEQIAGATAVNATDIVMARARLAQSLQDTLGYTGASGFSATPSAASAVSLSSVSAMGTGATATVSASSSNQELLSALVTEVQGLRAEVRADVSHNAKTAKILERANQDGETLSVSATIDGGVV